MKCIGEIDILTNTGPHTVSYVLRRSQYGTISGTTHIKTIFSFSPGMESTSYFLGNAIRRSDSSLTQPFHILYFFIINNILSNPKKKNSRGLIFGE
jgi:hypothetical protein